MRFAQLRNWLFGPRTAATISPSMATTAPATAVAGYLHRLVVPVEFQLSARLSSVAHLNTRAGRVPHCPGQRRTNAKDQPKVQNPCRKRSKVSAPQPRFAAGAPAKQNSAAIIQLPASGSRRIPLDVRIARAA
jgi:hypothetical protein